MAGTFDLARTEHAFGVSQQDDFEQDFGMDGGRAGLSAAAHSLATLPAFCGI
jgi:hypothetical protein